jgi:hypothetical protein
LSLDFSIYLKLRINLVELSRRKSKNLKDEMNELERDKQDLVSRHKNILEGLDVIIFIGKGSE